MKGAIETDITYEPEVDTSDSRVIEHEKHIILLHKENKELCNYYNITIKKLNVALRVVTGIQNIVYDNTQLSHKVPISKLNLPSAIKDSSEFPASDLFFK